MAQSPPWQGSQPMLGRTTERTSPSRALPATGDDRTTGRARRNDRARRTGRRRSRPFGIPWIAPALIVSVGLIYYCIAYTGFISTWNWDGVSPTHEPVGLGNYRQLLADPVFWGTLRHALLFFVITLTAQVVLGMIFAALLHSKVWLGGIYKVIIFIPVVLAPATVAPVFREIFAPNGQFNQVLQFVGLQSLTQDWLAKPQTALAVIIAIGIWESTGVAFILYFAAMSQIDGEMIEAARLDGAGAVPMFTRIIWPSVRGTTAALSVLTAIWSLKLFDIPYLVTAGGPDYGTEFLGTFIYRVSIPQAEVGYGAAISIVLLILAVGASILLTVGFRLRHRSE
jgi:raffinose/stachyose/melibiose transport system permease protein